MSLYFSISLRIRYVYGRIIPPYICYFMQCDARGGGLDGDHAIGIDANVRGWHLENP